MSSEETISLRRKRNYRQCFADGIKMVTNHSFSAFRILFVPALLASFVWSLVLISLLHVFENVLTSAVLVVLALLLHTVYQAVELFHTSYYFKNQKFPKQNAHLWKTLLPTLKVLFLVRGVELVILVAAIVGCAHYSNIYAFSASGLLVLLLIWLDKYTICAPEWFEKSPLHAWKSVGRRSEKRFGTMCLLLLTYIFVMSATAFVVSVPCQFIYFVSEASAWSQRMGDSGVGSEVPAWAMCLAYIYTVCAIALLYVVRLDFSWIFSFHNLTQMMNEESLQVGENRNTDVLLNMSKSQIKSGKMQPVGKP